MFLKNIHMSFRISDYTGHYPALIKLGLPILVSQLGMIVVGFADNIMVGHYSTPSLASASFVNNVFNIAILACLGFSYGLTPLVGAMFNQGRLRGIGALMRNGLMINLIFSVLLTLVMGVLYLNLHRLGQPEELLPIIRPYYLIYLAGVIPVALFNVFAQWSYAITNSRMPMWIILVANAANILGNWLLIFGNWGCPELGLLGAGISTLFARLLCMVAIIWIFFWHRSYREYSDGYRQARVTRTEMLHVFRTSMPISLQMTLETSAFSLCAIMAGWIDAISLAAFQIIVITGTLGFCIYYSLGAAIAVYVANAEGAGDRPKVRNVAFAGYQLMLVLMVVSSLVFTFFGNGIMAVFTDDPAVRLVTATLIFPLVLYQLGDATQITFANALRGTSHVMPMFWIALVCYLFVGIPSTYIMAFTLDMGVYGIVLSFSVSLFLAAALFLYFFMRASRVGVRQ